MNLQKNMRQLTDVFSMVCFCVSFRCIDEEILENLEVGSGSRQHYNIIWKQLLHVKCDPLRADDLSASAMCVL